VTLKPCVEILRRCKVASSLRAPGVFLGLLGLAWATVASAATVVDLSIWIDAPFVIPLGQPFTYSIHVHNAYLPLTPPALAGWESLYGLTISGGCDAFFLRGAVNSISEAPAVIPERPAVSLGEAVEVRWLSRLGYFYQIQSSADMETWADVGEPVLGDGTELSRFFARQTARNFYRAEIANFPR